MKTRGDEFIPGVWAHDEADLRWRRPFGYVEPDWEALGRLLKTLKEQQAQNQREAGLATENRGHVAGAIRSG